MADVQVVRPHVFDTWMAFLAGASVWYDRADGPPSTRERAAAGGMILALSVTVLVLWVTVSSRADWWTTSGISDRDLVMVAIGGTLAAAALAVRPTRVLAGERSTAAGFWWSLCWRGVAYLTLIVAMASLLPRFRVLGAVPLGLLGGADVLATMWAIGVPADPGTWLKRLLFSGVHFGALGAMIGTAVFDREGVSTQTLLGMYVAMWTAVGVAALTILAAHRFLELVDAERAHDEAELRARERTLRVHWLHDDVLSEVKLATLRLEAQGDVDAARRELQELDHRLRVRQLEDSMRGGRAHLYEIIQPHLRRAQALGIRLDRVPALDRTSRQVDETTARLVHRAVSNLVANALNAGATRLSLSIEESDDPPALDISVTDDAGGFSLDDVAPGRGLALLMRDLGPDTVRRRDAPEGSTVTVRVLLATTDRPPISSRQPQEATST